MGNMMQEKLFEIWTGKIIEKYRKKLLEGKRCYSPCTLCNAEGTVLGKNHADAWKITQELIHLRLGHRMRKLTTGLLTSTQFHTPFGSWWSTFLE